MSVEITAKDAKDAKDSIVTACATLCPPDAASFRDTGETLGLPLVLLAFLASFAVQSLWKYTRVFHDLGRGLPLMRVSVQHYTR